MMRLLFILLTIFMVPACAHAPQSCEMHCMSRGGSCDYIEQGWSRYNTATGHLEEKPTHFVCKYRW